MIANFSDHAANERTFLAWVRTAMALVAFGLALSRFEDDPPDAVTEAALVGLGVLVVAIAWLRMHLLMRHIDKPETYPFTSGILGLFMAMATTAIALLVLLFGLHMV